jgi:hypothetical protein
MCEGRLAGPPFVGTNRTFLYQDLHILCNGILASYGLSQYMSCIIKHATEKAG